VEIETESSHLNADAKGAAGEPEVDGPRRLENRTLRDQVLDRLREDILSGELDAGTVLGEGALAESFGVSRGPVREALSRLASEGLVTLVPRRGAEVTRLSREEFLDAYQVREALETLAIRLAVPRLGDAELALLRSLHEEMVEHAERAEVHAFFDANARFHQVFVEASGNRKLEEFYRLLLGQMGRYLARSLALRGTLERSVSEHLAILEAVEAGDTELAASLLADHIEVPQRELAGADELFTEEDGDRKAGRPGRVEQASR
jgi:DNA-binding GntR family transcriptional regulator